MKLMIPSKQLIIHNLKENEGDIDGDDDNLIINIVSGAQATMVADQGLINIPSIINLCFVFSSPGYSLSSLNSLGFSLNKLLLERNRRKEEEQEEEEEEEEEEEKS